jgi:hypothetical protein
MYIQNYLVWRISSSDLIGLLQDNIEIKYYLNTVLFKHKD